MRKTHLAKQNNITADEKSGGTENVRTVARVVDYKHYTWILERPTHYNRWEKMLENKREFMNNH